jgi:hypothetical protein
MAIIFDGPNKLLILSAGTTELNVPAAYSAWKDRVLAGNAQYPPAFASVGGDPIDAGQGTAVPFYDFLVNGWRVRPQEADHTLSVTGGILLVYGGGDPFVNTLGNYVVRINYQQPVQAITVSTGGGTAPTAEQNAAAVWAHATGAAVAVRLAEVWGRLGLDASKPVTQGNTQISFGDIVLQLALDESGNGTVNRL